MGDSIENGKVNSTSTECSTCRTCRLEVITPLAKRLNCLDLEKIANICIDDIPELIGASLASLYVLDDEGDILHLQKNNHKFPINNIVSLNQNPPSPMVAAARKGELLVVDDIESYQKPTIRNTPPAIFRPI